MKLSVLRETRPGERRVALVPTHVAQLAQLGVEVQVEAGAGEAAGYADAEYSAKGAVLAADPRQLADARLILAVRLAGAAGPPRVDEIPWSSQNVAIGLADPLGEPRAIDAFARRGAALFALELVPRITRAQSMDVLSSQATVAGYRAVVLAAFELPRLFPLLMTAAGTIKAAQVLVLGAGVAGLQAIATARKLGAVVSAYDVRPACREQIESLGAKFVDLKLDAAGAEDRGGYARAMGDAFAQQQRERLAEFVARSDVVLCTAAIPGKRSPVLVTRGAVAGMAPGSVIVDLAAERGGNCELSVADERRVEYGVTVLAPTNLAASAPYHASQMFSANVVKFLGGLIKQGELVWNLEDEVVRETLVARGGEVMHPRVRELLALPASPGSVPWSP